MGMMNVSDVLCHFGQTKSSQVFTTVFLSAVLQNFCAIYSSCLSKSNGKAGVHNLMFIMVYC